mgnify:CR=1 FL=1
MLEKNKNFPAVCVQTDIVKSQHYDIGSPVSECGIYALTNEKREI